MDPGWLVIAVFERIRPVFVGPAGNAASFRQVRTDWQGKEWTPDVDKNGGKAVTNSASTSITRVDRNEPDTSIARFLQVYSSSTSRICQPPKRQDPDIATGSWQRRNRAPA